MGGKITIIDRTEKRVAVQITEITYDPKKKSRVRKPISHLTIQGISGEDAERLIRNALQSASK